MTRPDYGLCQPLHPIFSTSCHSLFHSLCPKGPRDPHPHSTTPLSYLSALHLCSRWPLCPIFSSLQTLCLVTPNSYSHFMTQFRWHLFLDSLDFLPGWQIHLLGTSVCLPITAFLPYTRLWISQGKKTVIYLCHPKGRRERFMSLGQGNIRKAGPQTGDNLRKD